jgi:2-iminobutanoate/2-iminopropanoate deaminase
MTKKIISTSTAPAAIGPYNQAVVANGMVFCSGQIPLNPLSGNGLVPGGIDIQTRQVLTNLSELLKASGSDISKVVKTTVYLTDMGDFAAMNEVYAEFFTEDQPARATVAVRTLPMNVMVEIDCIALV